MTNRTEVELPKCATQREMPASTMTKREAFAMSIFSGLCANSSATLAMTPEELAEAAVDRADLLVDALNGF